MSTMQSPVYPDGTTKGKSPVVAVQLKRARSESGESSSATASDDSQSTSGLASERKRAKATHVCEVCSKSFATPSKLERHMHMHTGEQPFACDFASCDKKFAQASNLKTHIRTHTGEKPFVCGFDSCDKKFARSCDLKTHIRVHTGEKSFVCGFESCDKKFALASNLKTHIRTHTGEKPFMCDFTDCGWKFAQSSSLSNHIKTHSPCVHCNNPGSLAGIDACADCAGTRLEIYGCTVANCHRLGTRGPEDARICQAHHSNGVCACTSPCLSKAAGACFNCIADDSPQLHQLGLACSVDSAKVCTPNATVCSACVIEYGLQDASMESLAINTVALILGMDTRSIFMTREVIIKACNPSKNACATVNGGARGDWGLRGLNCINFIEIDDAKGHRDYDEVREIARLNLLDGMRNGGYNETGQDLTIGCTRFSGEFGWGLEQLRGFAQVVRDSNRVLEENPSDRMRLVMCNFKENNKFRGAMRSTGQDYDINNDEYTDEVVLDDDIAQWTWASDEHRTAAEREARHMEVLHTMKNSGLCICASQLGTTRERICTGKVTKTGEIFCNHCLKKPKAKRVIFDRK